MQCLQEYIQCIFCSVEKSLSAPLASSPSRSPSLSLSPSRACVCAPGQRAASCDLSALIAGAAPRLLAVIIKSAPSRNGLHLLLFPLRSLPEWILCFGNVLVLALLVCFLLTNFFFLFFFFLLLCVRQQWRNMKKRSGEVRVRGCLCLCDASVTSSSPTVSTSVRGRRRQTHFPPFQVARLCQGE